MRLTDSHRQLPPDWVRCGQAISIAKGFIAIVILGLFWSLSQEVMVPLNAKRKEHITNADATTGLDWTFQMHQNFPFVAMGVIVFGGIVFAVYLQKF